MRTAACHGSEQALNLPNPCSRARGDLAGWRLLPDHIKCLPERVPGVTAADGQLSLAIFVAVICDLLRTRPFKCSTSSTAALSRPEPNCAHSRAPVFLSHQSATANFVVFTPCIMYVALASLPCLRCRKPHTM